MLKSADQLHSMINDIANSEEVSIEDNQKALKSIGDGSFEGATDSNSKSSEKENEELQLITEEKTESSLEEKPIMQTTKETVSDKKF